MELKYLLVAGVLAGAVLLGFILQSFLFSHPTTIGEGEPLTLSFSDIHGRSYRLSSFRGKVVIIGFISLWCGACKVQIQSYEEVWKEYRDRLVIVIVDVDPEATEKLLEPMSKDYGGGSWIWVKGSSDMIQRFNALIVPKTLIIDGEGRVAFSHLGLVPAETLSEEVSQLLGV